jgi:23S rRNA (adenine-N6)-dimethyltransferase
VRARRFRTPPDARRRAYAQNFLASSALAARLVQEADVGCSDLVVELGAGTGVLTAELGRQAAAVRAVELDPILAAGLRRRFAESRNVTVVEANARSVVLPPMPFRVVANLPFNATTAVLKRLLDPRGRLERADLVLQWEVARKRVGRPRTALSASWSPWWRFRLGRRIPSSAFRPRPTVEAGVLVVERRDPPLLPAGVYEDYARFVTALFEGTLVRELDAPRFAAIFEGYSAASRGRRDDTSALERRDE